MTLQPDSHDERSRTADHVTTGTVGSPDDRCLAVDIGGTKMAVGVVDGTGRLTDRASAPTPRSDDGEELFATLAGLLAPLAPFDRYLVCGVGCGGPMSPGGLEVSPLNIHAWRGFPLTARLAEHTGLRTRVDNDAKALALAEGWVGAAAGRRDFLAMVVSTGVGGGIVLDGRLLDGAGGNAGHIGHVVVDVPGRELPGHVSGVLEAEASGTAIAHHTGAHPAEAPGAERAKVGRLVGQAVGSVANLLDLPLALVAGSVALGYGDEFFAAAQAEVDRVCRLDYSIGTRIAPAGCGDEGPLIGAGAVGFRHLGHRIGAIEPE
ncbi:MAG: ROK family protein [Actinomycetota bacterium]